MGEEDFEVEKMCKHKRVKEKIDIKRKQHVKRRLMENYQRSLT